MALLRVPRQMGVHFLLESGWQGHPFIRSEKGKGLNLKWRLRVSCPMEIHLMRRIHKGTKAVLWCYFIFCILSTPQHSKLIMFFLSSPYLVHISPSTPTEFE